MTSSGWSFPGVWWVQSSENHLWASYWKSEADLSLLMKSLIAERFARAKEIRAEAGEQQRKLNIYFSLMVWSHVRNMPSPELSILVDKGQLLEVCGQKLIRAWEMISWNGLGPTFCTWKCSGRAKSSQEHNSSELLGNTSSENIKEPLFLFPFLSPAFPPPDSVCEDIRSSPWHWISFWRCWFSFSPFSFWVNLE